MADYLIKRTDESTVDQQVRVYMDSFGHKPEEFGEVKEKWLAKHYRNPSGPSYIFGAFDGDELVGINCFLRMDYRLNGEPASILQSCESGVLHTHQRRGIWGKIMRFACEYLKNETDAALIIGFPNYRNSYPGFVKMGWDTLFHERNYLLVNNGAQAARMFAGDRWFARLGGPLRMQRWKVFLNAKKEYTVSEAQTFRYTETRGMKLNVTPAWIEWKKRYAGMMIHEVKKAGQTAAYVLSQEDALDGVKYLKILDVIPVSGAADAKAAFSSYLRAVRGKGYGVIRAWSKNPGIYAELGFLEMKKHLNPFITLLLKDGKDELKRQDVWDPSFLDLD